LRKQVIPAHIEKKKEDDNGGQSKKAIAAREKIESLRADLEKLDAVGKFEYNDSNFSDYGQGQLNHDDIIDVAALLIIENEILQRITGQKYPYIFVDEAQDTFGNVVAALNNLCEKEGLPIIGYFGDPMQQIYDNRAGYFGGTKGFVTIPKLENFRCSCKVIDLLNAFRKDIEQFPAGKNRRVEGSVLIRLVQAETPEGPRKKYSDEQIERASAHFEEALRSWGWDKNNNVKRLFLVRQMIARRLGFSKLQELFTGQFSSSKSQDEYEKGEHYLLKPFVNSLCPLIQAQNNGDISLVLDILRKTSPAFNPEGFNAEQTLGEMKERSTRVMQQLSKLWSEGSLGEILKFSLENNLIKNSDRLTAHMHRSPREEEYNPDLHSNDKGDWLIDQFFKMSTTEIAPFVAFVNENTPLSTQHGVKGEEYENVLVVFDDTEAAWNNYSFTKTLTPNTSGLPTEGQYDRSKKLAYVCFSRAEVNLRILLFTLDPEGAQKELISAGLFKEDQIFISY
ncbi:MAG: UvrD-helicase domain-containing protein, partial [Anaerolineaceae bacterium]